MGLQQHGASVAVAVPRHRIPGTAAAGGRFSGGPLGGCPMAAVQLMFDMAMA